MENKTGHNLPPDMTITCAEVTQDLGAWMAENPVIESEEAARAAKVWIDRGNLAVKDLEDERTAKVRPLNEEIKNVNEHYRGPRELLAKVINELKIRIGRFIESEERKRIEAAERARALAEDAARVAREAERVEQDALAGASTGELDVNVADVTASADAAFADYQKAERQAAVAERETKVRVGGGFTRALGLRKAEIISIDNVFSVLRAVGPTPEIEAAMIKSARAYKKLTGKWPEGIVVTSMRRA